MKKIITLLCLAAIFIACKSSGKQVEVNQTEVTANQEAAELLLGAEQLHKYLPLLKGKRIGLVVNQTSTIGKTHLVDTLKSLGVNIIKVFAPEHGFRGDHSAGALINSGVDEKTGLPVLSLYGSTKKPTPEMLKDLDIVIFDIQDVGVRFYTYISTMHYVMEACAELGKKVVVLDRPNPNGFYIDGPILQDEYKSFIGMHPIPIVHGLTVGELAKMINGEKWLKNGVQCDLVVIPCANYTHQTLYQLPIKPSPNLPNMNAVYLYPYLGLFEGTNVSIGRGTEWPFQVVGRPGFDGGFSFTPKSIPGVADDPKHEGISCGGEYVLDVKDSSLFREPGLNLGWLILFHKTNRVEDGPYFKDFFYKLTGNKEFKSQIERGLSEDEIRKTWQGGLDDYKVKRKLYLLYP
ncbi:MAG: hypothetical protein RLZZ337_1374 [Bacteroidota bacterium]|jgi:uncharacterized protein YbbC (DUF1343 family)